MIEEILKAIPVFLFSMIKFIFGPTLGFAAGLHVITSILVTIAGMMTVVVAFTYFGDWIRSKLLSGMLKNRKRFTPGNRRLAGTWRKYGLTTIAALTPLVLTPLGGTILAVSSGNSKKRIIFYMFVSAIFWSLVLSSIVYFIGREVLPEFIR